MSSSRRARRRRRHERYGKPSYPVRPKNGLTPTASTVDEWVIYDNVDLQELDKDLFAKAEEPQPAEFKFRSKLFTRLLLE